MHKSLKVWHTEFMFKICSCSAKKHWSFLLIFLFFCCSSHTLLPVCIWVISFHRVEVVETIMASHSVEPATECTESHSTATRRHASYHCPLIALWVETLHWIQGGAVIKSTWRKQRRNSSRMNTTCGMRPGQGSYSYSTDDECGPTVQSVVSTSPCPEYFQQKQSVWNDKIKAWKSACICLNGRGNTFIYMQDNSCTHKNSLDSG